MNPRACRAMYRAPTSISTLTIPSSSYLSASSRFVKLLSFPSIQPEYLSCPLSSLSLPIFATPCLALTVLLPAHRPCSGSSSFIILHLLGLLAYESSPLSRFFFMLPTICLNLPYLVLFCFLTEGVLESAFCVFYSAFLNLPYLFLARPSWTLCFSAVWICRGRAV